MSIQDEIKKINEDTEEIRDIARTFQAPYDMELELQRKCRGDDFDLSQDQRDWIIEKLVDKMKSRLFDLDDELLLGEAKEGGII